MLQSGHESCIICFAGLDSIMCLLFLNVFLFLFLKKRKTLREESLALHEYLCNRKKKNNEMRDACKCTQDGDDAEKNG